MKKYLLIGNCQTTAIAWMLKLMNLNTIIRNISLATKFRYIGTNPGFYSCLRLRGDNVQIRQTKEDREKHFRWFSESDIIINQPIDYTKHLSNTGLKEDWEKQKDKTYISFASIFFDVRNHDGPELQGMIQREAEYDVTIKASEHIKKIIQDEGNAFHSQSFKGYQHHHINIYKEILKDICNLTGLDYDVRVIDYLEQDKLPYGQPNGWTSKT